MSLKHSLAIAFVSAFVLVTTAGAQERVGEPFQLGVGESVVIADAGFRVGFDRVTSDSRCPRNVECIWEGNSAARTWAETSRVDRTFFNLNTNPQFQGQASFIGFFVRLLGVAPHPVDGVIIDPNDYIVTMVVVRDRTTPVEEKTWGAIKALFE